MTMLRSALLGVGMILGLAARAGAQEFHVERDFDLLRDARGAALPSRYLVSLPLHPVIPDAGNAGVTTRSKCVGDAGGPVTGDGAIDALDLICAWWTSRFSPATAGPMSLVTWDPGLCVPVTYSASLGLGERMTTSGARFPVDPGAGILVIASVRAGATYSPRNHAVIEGDEDATWSGVPIAYSPTCGSLASRRHLLHVPYDVAYTKVAEIACGQRDVDWFDADGNGLPDTCWADADADRRYDAGERPTGLYDGRHSLVISREVAVRGAGGAPDQEYVESFIVMPGLGGRVSFAGVDFDLSTGESYVVDLTAGHVTTRWDPPLR